MSIIQVIVLAIIQGLTEFIPVSSSAHLILPGELLNWPDQGLAFDVALHIGSLLAVLIYFRNLVGDICISVLNFLRRKGSFDGNCRILLFMAVATIPCGLAGLLFDDLIEQYLRGYQVIAFTTLFFAGLLLIAEYVSDRLRKNAHQVETMEEGCVETANMTWRQVLWIGVAQALALIPGTSRSGITLTAGFFVGMSRRGAACFSFLLSIPVIVLSGGLEFVKLIKGDAPGTATLSDSLIGAFVSFVVSYLVIKFFMDFLNKFGILPYVIYRVLLGLFLVALIGCGVLN